MSQKAFPERLLISQGTNVVGHFVFAKLLIPSLKASAKTGVPDATRVVWTSSNAHNFAPKGFINFDDVNLDGYNKWTKYGQSKAVRCPFIVSFESRLTSLGESHPRDLDGASSG